MPSEITVYEAHQRRKTGLFEAVWRMTIDVVRCRELVWQLFKRDFLMTKDGGSGLQGSSGNPFAIQLPAFVKRVKARIVWIERRRLKRLAGRAEC
jgi:hypothetical protein